MKSPATPFRRRQSGFALLITITLLAFLVLLLVSLAALTRVETQVASNNQQLSQARQNALMALNVALGRLQAAAGPDTRVTATADIVAAHADKKHWTGVWNKAAPGADKNIAWLVSGSPAAGSATVATALPTSGVVSLVGENSTDITAAPSNEVKVPTEAITSDTVPGLTGTQTIGNFAYWVGDEGVKAKVSVSDPWTNAATLAATTPNTTADQAKLYRFVNAQRMGIEGVDAAAAGTRLGSAYPATDTTFTAALPKILSFSQLPLAHTVTASQNALTLAGRHRFHDLTASSYGLLTDVVKGGFKKDLTAWIADTAASNPVSSNAADDYITPGNASDTSKYGLPKWALLRDYATTQSTRLAPTDSPAAVAPRFQTDSKQGIYPVITYARVAYNITFPTMPAAGKYRYNIMPVVALWNPYNVPITAHDFEFCYKYVSSLGSGGGNSGVCFQMISFGPLTSWDLLDLGYVRLSNWRTPGMRKDYIDSTNVPKFWRFKLRMTRDLAPGESRLFMINDDTAHGDGTEYEHAQSIMSDEVVDQANAVYIPSINNYTTQTFQSLNTEFHSPSPAARMEFRLIEPAPAGATEADLISNSYQAVLGNALYWNSDTHQIPTDPTNTGTPLFYQSVELLMSTITASIAQGEAGTGEPRWIAVLNAQAPVMLHKPQATPGAANPSYQRRFYVRSPFSNGLTPPDLTPPTANLPNSSGGTVSAGMQVEISGAPQNLVLREFQPTDTLFSLAQLQHANVSSINLNPTYAIGNSLANLYVNRDSTASPLLGTDPYPGFPASGVLNHIYDLSYLLNQALWDGYFFSTVPSGPSGLTTAQANTPAYRLPNARLQFHWAGPDATDDEVDELKTTGKAASHLLVNGSFNINSTSEQAWRAFLYSHNGIPPADPAAPPASGYTHPYSRFAVPVDGATPNTTWLGYRILSDDQIDALAQAIVTQVRTRGPFLSLADFINRRLVADATGLKGPIQAAIDATTTGNGSINGGGPYDFGTMPVKAYVYDIGTDPEQQAIYVGDTNTTLPSTLPSSSRAAFSPGYLTQADLLTALGPSLSARSDTFRIRAYGDVVNPATGGTEGRAWCEAVVQRQLDYMDASADVSTVPPASATSALNQNFGRRFKIISFRWLSSNDI